jgi:hypothetical protein
MNFKKRVELISVKIYKFIKHLKESDFKGQKFQV